MSKRDDRANQRKLPLPRELPSQRKLPVVSPDGSEGMDRRQALKVMALAAAAPGVLASAACDPGVGGSDAATSGIASTQSPSSNPKAAGTLWDPDMLAPTVPWETLLTADELTSLASLCDVIIPADGRSPSASQVGAHEFVDEWVSAPYDGNQRDLVLIRGGLSWLDQEAAKRFGSGQRFRELTLAQKHAICDDISYRETATPGFEMASRFFDRVRDLTATAFWTTDEGMRDLEYIGNVAQALWGPPPTEVLEHLGLV